MTNIYKKEALKILNITNSEQENSFLSDSEMDIESPNFYIKQALSAIKQENLENGWLWIWRGLYEFEDNKTLHSLKDLLTSAIKPTNSLANKKLSILQGTIEIANQMNTIAKGTQKLGYRNNTLNYFPTYLNYSSNYMWPISKENKHQIGNKLTRFSSEIIPYYDLFHFHFGTSLTQTQSDIQLIKNEQKPILMHHWGSEVRILSEALKTNPFAKAKVLNERWIKNKLSMLGNQIEACVVADEELYQYVKNYYKKVYIVPLMVDLEVYKPKAHPNNKKFTIVHAPTSPEIKGTPYILKAMEELRESYDFDFQIIQGMSHEKAKQLYQSADLIIDQLHIGSYGLLAVESMAMGKPVICYISEFMRDQYSKDLPIITANPDTIVNVVKGLLEEPDQLQDIGVKGRKYVEQYHNMNTNSAKIAQIYDEQVNNK
ncbi:hypothetical protein GCM10008967_19160 [Bacillus carboniphilus]|uniref:Glycosyl transferase family 1 domain-containing protein n=1 Tax=Bacillus carboniphilus TaxID=86663 RepID=A0ABP3G0C9_9BACI